MASSVWSGFINFWLGSWFRMSKRFSILLIWTWFFLRHHDWCDLVNNFGLSLFCFNLLIFLYCLARFVNWRLFSRFWGFFLRLNLYVFFWLQHSFLNFNPQLGLFLDCLSLLLLDFVLFFDRLTRRRFLLNFNLWFFLSFILFRNR